MTHATSKRSDRRGAFRGGRRQEDWPHGTRARYLRGCRCVQCRSAHAQYVYAQWRGQIAPLVLAAQAKAKLEQLARAGVGHRRAADLAGVSERTVLRIRLGQTLRIHATVEAAILGIRPSLAHGCYVDIPQAAIAKRWLLSLLGEDFTAAQIAPTIGVSPAQVRAIVAPRQRVKRMRVGTVIRLRAFWQQVNRDGEQAS